MRPQMLARKRLGRGSVHGKCSLRSVYATFIGRQRTATSKKMWGKISAQRTLRALRAHVFGEYAAGDARVLRAFDDRSAVLE